MYERVFVGSEQSGWITSLSLSCGQEFNWFFEKRHKFLTKPKPYNYSVYVRNVPPEYRSNARLEEYFRLCLAGDPVLEARLRVKTSELTKVVSRRSSAIDNFEGAIAIEKVRGAPPTHRHGGLLGARVYSIPTYADNIKDLNREVTKRIEDIELKVARGVSTSQSLLSRILTGDIKGATEILPGVKQIGNVLTNVRRNSVIKVDFANDEYESQNRPTGQLTRGLKQKAESGATSPSSIFNPSSLMSEVRKGASGTMNLIADAPALFTKGTTATASLITSGAEGTVNFLTEAPSFLQNGASGIASTALTMVTGVAEEGDS
jgi:hypothetical protein